MRQALSQAGVSGVAEVSWRNHAVQNQRTYFILYFITIKWIMCVQEENGLSHKSQRS